MSNRSQTIDGFDEEGGWDPTVSLTEDSIMIEFPEFPPQNVAEQGLEDTYDEHLSQKLGIEVEWEDREVFWIDTESVADPEGLFNKVVEFFQNQVEETEGASST